jgi:DNA invertase Pin-like site-specific DNA recombinase
MIVGYTCPQNLAKNGLTDEDSQRAALDDYCKQNSLALSSNFRDDVGAASTPWLERPAGRQLASQLGKGSQVVVADAAVVYTSAADLLSIIHSFQARGIVLHFARFQLPGNERASLSTADEAMREALTTALTASCSFSRLRGEAIAEGMARTREEGRRHCRDAAGYGFKWKRGKRVPDETEKAVIAKIVQWREVMGCSWYEIAAHLLHCGVTVGSTGREWSPSRVRRAYLTDLQRRAIVGCPTS